MNPEVLKKVYICFIAGGCAIPVFQLVVGAFGGIFHLDVDFDGDSGEGPIPGGIMSLAFFAVVFGALGRLFVGRVPPVASLLIGAAGGVLGAWLLARFIIRPLRRSNPAAGRIENLRWQTGRVKMEIREDFVGSITVLSSIGSLVTYDAKPIPGVERIPAGEEVMIVEVDAEHMVCTVSPMRRGT